MDIGMLWYDDDKQRTVEEKVLRAAEYYRAKFGVPVTDCYVHPFNFETTGGMVAGIKMHSDKKVIKNHFWLGVGDKPAPKPVSQNGAVVAQVKSV